VRFKCIGGIGKGGKLESHGVPHHEKGLKGCLEDRKPMLPCEGGKGGSPDLEGQKKKWKVSNINRVPAGFHNPIRKVGSIVVNMKIIYMTKITLFLWLKYALS
jgi:hypothetical protein